MTALSLLQKQAENSELMSDSQTLTAYDAQSTKSLIQRKGGW